MAAPERWHQRAADLRFDLLRLEAIVRSHSDCAADVVNENVDASEALDRFGHSPCGPLVRLKVAYEAAPPDAGLRRDVTYEVRSIDEQDIAPFRCGPQRHRASDTLGCAGHDQGLSREAVGEDHAATPSVAENFS